MDKIETMIRGELTRKEKIQQINTVKKIENSVYAEMTDQEVDDLYDRHFNKVTEEDFEIFKRLTMILVRKGVWNLVRMDECKKELGL